MAFEHKNALLQEYQQCDEKISRLDSLIWQTASVIFPITLAGFGYFGLSVNHTSEQFFILAAVSIGSITLLVTWYLLSRTWHSYQSIAFYRMREIEKELDLWHYRYSFFVRKSAKQRKIFLEHAENKDRYTKIEKSISGFYKVGLRATTTIITIIFVTGWLSLIIREYILTF